MNLYFNKLSKDESNLKILPKDNIRPVTFHIIQYDELHYDEHHFNSLTELNSYLTTTSYSSEDYCTWINIEGIHETAILDELSIRFNIHTLIKEDISTENERMKLDLLDNGSCIYLLLKLVYMSHDTNLDDDCISHEQISILLKKNNFLLTFQKEKKQSNFKDIFQGVKHRLKNNRGRVRTLKIDYLFYCLLDVIIEHYMSVLDHISVKIDSLEKLLMKKLKQNTIINYYSNGKNFEQLKLLFSLKHQMLKMRILCQPLREIIIKLQKAQDRISVANRSVHSRRQYRRKKRPKHIALSGNYFINPNSDALTRRWSLGRVEDKAPLFNEYIFLYFKDLNDHIIQLQDRIDTYCDLLSSLILLNVLLNDAEMNKTMKTLTFVSSIFIPLTFILGLFSTNFQNCPPLVWINGYYCILAVLGICIIFMIGFFKWKKWF
ncbi:hypothetical protein I4U23_026977 [Adineta vaga]|nr:hypothetical protein I4U23_026977 [Adineta vaga]